MTSFRPGLHVCMNCSSPTKGKHDFQGVILCSHCKGLANTCVANCEQQLKQLEVMYLESLRVALASGRLRPVSKPETGKRKKPSVDDLKRFLGDLADVSKS